MLSHIRITNYQSLGDIKLTLQPLTVIVGPSSSGKSAFTRAMKCLTSNQRGDSFITHGEQQTTIIAKVDRGTVALQRGKKNEYTVIPEDDASQQRHYTKLAGNVPEDVSEFIGIPAKDPLNYSNQFDMPYLLTASAGEVARTLGELTNVSVIFEAAREANRQRLAASGHLKTRAADYADLTVNLEKYRTLKADITAIEEAEQIMAAAREKATRIQRLRAAAETIKSIPTFPEPRAIPDISGLVEKQQRKQRLEQLAGHLLTAEKDSESAASQLLQWEHQTKSAQEAYYEALREGGTCPTCGQGTKHLHQEPTP